MDTLQQYRLSFFYHMWGSSIGKLALEVTSNSGITEIWNQVGQGEHNKYQDHLFTISVHIIETMACNVSKLNAKQRNRYVNSEGE
jgi:hypothetical protein